MSDAKRSPLPASPCVRNCCLDDSDICLGCGRSLEEIIAWGSADAATQQQILERAAERRHQREGSKR